MFCSKCGANMEISNNFCGNCGNKVEKSGGRITICRPSNFVGCAIGYSVEVDGNPIGTLQNGGMLFVDVPFGTHRLSFNYWCGSGTSDIVVTSEFPNVYVDIGIKMGLITNKVEVTNIRQER